MATKKELKARVRELEVENARLRGENAALRLPTIPGPVQVGDVPPWRPGLSQIWCGTTTASGNVKHYDDSDAAAREHADILDLLNRCS